MIASFLKIVFIMYLTASIMEIRNIHVYNLDSTLITIQEYINRENVQSELENLSPILLKNIYDDDFCNVNLMKKNPGYMIQDSARFISLRELKDDYHIYENDKMVSDLNVNTEQVFSIFEKKLSTNRRSYLSLYGGDVQSVLLKCVSNVTSYTCSSSFTFYLFNPKHINDILGKELMKIKKWAIKVNVEKGDILYIPCEWNYIYEGKGNLLKLTIDNYFSVGYNLLRK